jgi:hypothetical protein
MAALPTHSHHRAPLVHFLSKGLDSTTAASLLHCSASYVRQAKRKDWSDSDLLQDKYARDVKRQKTDPAVLTELCDFLAASCPTKSGERSITYRQYVSDDALYQAYSTTALSPLSLHTFSDIKQWMRVKHAGKYLVSRAQWKERKKQCCSTLFIFVFKGNTLIILCSLLLLIFPLFVDDRVSSTAPAASASSNSHLSSLQLRPPHSEWSSVKKCSAANVTNSCVFATPSAPAQQVSAPTSLFAHPDGFYLRVSYPENWTQDRNFHRSRFHHCYGVHRSNRPPLQGISRFSLRLRRDKQE